MDGIGESEQALAVRACTGTLLAAAFPGAPTPDADPYYGLPYDDDLDAAYPASLPEDPFPEALFADRPFDGDLRFDDGGPFDGGAIARQLAAGTGVQDRRTALGWVPPAADLTADNAGLIDQVRAISPALSAVR